MIFFRGLGILALIIPFACAILSQLIFEDIPFYAGVGYLIGGIITLILGLKFNKNKQTNPRSLLRHVESHHALFFVRMEFWGILIIIAAICMMIPSAEFIVTRLIQVTAIIILIALGIHLYEKYILRLSDEPVDIKSKSSDIKQETKKEKINFDRAEKKDTSSKLNPEFIKSMKSLKTQTKEINPSDHSKYMPPKGE